VKLSALFRLRPFARGARGAAPRPRRSKRGRAALALACGGGAFALLQLAFVLFTEHSPDLSDPIYAARERQLAALRAARPNERLVLFLGSSRVQDAFRAGDVKGATAFNFGTPGAGPITNALYLRRLIAEGHAPDALVLELMYPLCTDAAPWPQEAPLLTADRATRAERDLLTDRYGFPADYYRRQWRKAALVPFLTHGFKLLGRAAPNAVPSDRVSRAAHGADDHGWLAPMEALKPDAAKCAKQLANYKPWVENWRAGPWTHAALTDTLDLCRARGIPVALVLMPEGSAFRALAAPDARERVRAYHAELSAAFGCSVVDAREWFPDDQFLDGHHLLRPATGPFTARLISESIAPLLQARGAK
jgi:hypothetical protein